MDPQATWNQLLDAYTTCDWEETDACATALLEWLDGGGFPPQIVARTNLGPRFQRILARAVCSFARRQARRARRQP